MPISKTYRRSQTKEKRKMTDYNSINIRTIQRMSAGSAEYQKFMAQMGDNTASKVGDTTADTELLFNTMQYYKTMEYADDWSDDAKALSVEDLIKLWRTEDDADKSFVTDFMEFNALMQGYSKTEPEDPTPPENEDFVRPYIPDDNLTDDQKNRMKDFDLMRAHDVSLSGDTENYPDLAGLSAENGDYELLFEYLRQREGTSFLYPSDYNEDGTLKESGQTKETEMIAKLQELCTADPTKKIGTVLNEFLEAYSVSEPTETQYGAVDSDKLKDMLGKGATTNIKKGEPKTITIGENEYLVTNIGDDNTTSFKYEVKSETKDGKTHVYIHMEGNNLRIQDVSGKLQGDVIELQGNGNEIDLGMGDDILSIIGENNRALMGDGDDKVYIQGDNNFSDLWRGDDSLFNIDNAYTIGIGFTGDDEFYTKGDNVVVNGESPHQGQLAAGEVGDGLYKDGVTEEHDIERDLTKPSWFPPTTPEEPEDPDEPGEHDPSDGPIIDFDGVRYRVYRKIAGKFDPTETIKYYKDDQNRTVFEANGWYIAVLYSLNDTNDKDYSNVVIKGDRNTLIGSKDNDKIDIQGSDNWISADAEDNIHKEGGDDAIKITSGTGNSIYGEYGNDSLEGNLDGNFFNILRTDIETINGQPVTPPDDDDDDDTDSADPAGAGDDKGDSGDSNGGASTGGVDGNNGNGSAGTGDGAGAGNGNGGVDSGDGTSGNGDGGNGDGDGNGSGGGTSGDGDADKGGAGTGTGAGAGTGTGTGTGEGAGGTGTNTENGDNDPNKVNGNGNGTGNGDSDGDNGDDDGDSIGGGGSGNAGGVTATTYATAPAKPNEALSTWYSLWMDVQNATTAEEVSDNQCKMIQFKNTISSSDDYLDLNGDGTVNYKDFIELAKGIDFNGDGKLDDDEKAFIFANEAYWDAYVYDNVDNFGTANATLDDLAALEAAIENRGNIFKEYVQTPEWYALDNTLVGIHSAMFKAITGETTTAWDNDYYDSHNACILDSESKLEAARILLYGNATAKEQEFAREILGSDASKVDENYVKNLEGLVLAAYRQSGFTYGNNEESLAEITEFARNRLGEATNQGKYELNEANVKTMEKLRLADSILNTTDPTLKAIVNNMSDAELAYLETIDITIRSVSWYNYEEEVIPQYALIKSDEDGLYHIHCYKDGWSQLNLDTGEFEWAGESASNCAQNIMIVKANTQEVGTGKYETVQVGVNLVHHDAEYLTDPDDPTKKTLLRSAWDEEIPIYEEREIMKTIVISCSAEKYPHTSPVTGGWVGPDAK